MAARKATAAKKTVEAQEAEETKVTEKEAEETATAVEKKAAEKKPEAKKTAAKTSGRKTAVKETVYVQYMGKEFDTADILKKVKENWTKVLKNKVGDMKDVTLYVKPEEGRAYFVINGDVTGSVEL